MFDMQDPFFRPLWLRVAIVVVCLGWALVELIGNSPGWALLFGAAGVYAGYSFFVVWSPREEDDDDNE